MFCDKASEVSLHKGLQRRVVSQEDEGSIPVEVHWVLEQIIVRLHY